ncbi:MAG: rhodanese-like domain-containing protein [Crocinitomicaceae bacterium]|nr:rhodanese-like domain-containing protein [Crocinitomicaceae bacterium]
MLNRIFMVLGLFLAISCSSSTEAQVSDIDVKEFKAKFEGKNDVQVLDVRTPNEIAQGKIDGASENNFMGPNFEQNLAKLDKNKPVVVYCASGGRSAKAAAIMEEKGFTVVYNLLGGFNAYSQQN